MIMICENYTFYTIFIFIFHVKTYTKQFCQLQVSIPQNISAASLLCESYNIKSPDGDTASFFLCELRL